MIAKGDRDYATAVDVEIERGIREILREADPNIAFLGEEEGLSPAEAGAMWVLDPIDGTINFSKGSPLCAVSLALVEAGRPILGIVDLPLLGERYVAREGMGAFMNGRRIKVSETADLAQCGDRLRRFRRRFEIGGGERAASGDHAAARDRESADPGPRFGEPGPCLAGCRTFERKPDALQPAVGRQRRCPLGTRGGGRGL